MILLVDQKQDLEFYFYTELDKTFNILFKTVQNSVDLNKKKIDSGQV